MLTRFGLNYFLAKIFSFKSIYKDFSNLSSIFPEGGQGTIEYQIDELYKIFRTLGTPTEQSWPGVTRLPDYKQTFPKWPARPLSQRVPTLDPAGVDLLRKTLIYEPSARITAKTSMDHEYFNGLDKNAV